MGQFLVGPFQIKPEKLLFRAAVGAFAVRRGAVAQREFGDVLLHRFGSCFITVVPEGKGTSGLHHLEAESKAARARLFKVGPFGIC